MIVYARKEIYSSAQSKRCVNKTAVTIRVFGFYTAVAVVLWILYFATSRATSPLYLIMLFLITSPLLTVVLVYFVASLLLFSFPPFSLSLVFVQSRTFTGFTTLTHTYRNLGAPIHARTHKSSITCSGLGLSHLKGQSDIVLFL